MNTQQSLGAALLRIGTGIVFIAHSAYLKIFVFTVPGTVGFFESIGLPAILAYATIVAEIVGGLMLIAGVRVREAAIALTIVGLGATWAHFGAGWLFTNQGGGFEYPLFLAVATASVALIGPGSLRLSLPTVSAEKVSA